jgi:hypothetical protein
VTTDLRFAADEPISAHGGIPTEIGFIRQAHEGAYELHFDLPDPVAARNFQVNSIGDRPGAWNIRDNSCLTCCARVLREGGHPAFASLDDEAATDVLRDMIPPEIYRP